VYRCLGIESVARIYANREPLRGLTVAVPGGGGARSRPNSSAPRWSCFHAMRLDVPETGPSGCKGHSSIALAMGQNRILKGLWLCRSVTSSQVEGADVRPVPLHGPSDSLRAGSDHELGSVLDVGLWYDSVENCRRTWWGLGGQQGGEA
jgi:hypothetical protein